MDDNYNYEKMFNMVLLKLQIKTTMKSLYIPIKWTDPNTDNLNLW